MVKTQQSAPYSEFILEATFGVHPQMQEERLTRVLTSCFNHSKSVRRAIGKLYGGDYTLCHAAAEQRSRGDKVRKAAGRRDIEIREGGQPLLIIENKIGALLERSQLEKYRTSRRTKVVALIKATAIKTDVLKHFRVKRWNELYAILESYSEQAREPDKFVTRQLMTFLEVHGMDRGFQFKKDDLTKCAKLIHHLRFEDRCEVSLGGKQFEILAELDHFFQSIIEIARENRHLVKRVGKKFNKATHLGWTLEDDEKWAAPFIGIWLELQKPYKNVKFLCFGFNVKEDGKWYFEASVFDKSSEFIDREPQKNLRKTISMDLLRKDVLKSWNHWLGLKGAQRMMV